MAVPCIKLISTALYIELVGTVQLLGTAHLGRERQKLTAVCWVAVLGTALLDESIALLQCINPPRLSH